MKKRFTEEQIIGVLKEAEAGMKVAEVYRTKAGGSPGPRSVLAMHLAMM